MHASARNIMLGHWSWSRASFAKKNYYEYKMSRKKFSIKFHRCFFFNTMATNLHSTKHANLTFMVKVPYIMYNHAVGCRNLRIKIMHKTKQVHLTWRKSTLLIIGHSTQIFSVILLNVWKIITSYLYIMLPNTAITKNVKAMTIKIRKACLPSPGEHQAFWDL